MALSDPDLSIDPPAPLFEVRCDRPWLVATFPRGQAALSWAMARPGFQTTDRVAWLEVRNADLPVEVDAFALLEARLTADGHDGAIAMMTARDVRLHHVADAACGRVRARCLATVGLRNGGRIGAAPVQGRLGTINLLAAVSCALTEAAQVEALSIATEARTAAVIDLGWRVGGEAVTGTGTDCVVMCAPVPPQAALEEGSEPVGFAGLHTDVGAALGAAVYEAVAAGGREWIAEQG